MVSAGNEATGVIQNLRPMLLAQQFAELKNYVLSLFN